MNKKYYLTTILCLLIAITNLNGQSIKELERQKQKAKEKLEATQKLLNKVKKSKTGTSKEINLLNKYIKETNNLLFAINSEIDGLNRDIENLNIEKDNLNKRLEQTKKDYAKMISKNEIYRKQFSPALFIFSSKNFNQVIRRARYLIEMADYRKKQVAEIKALTKSISDKENILQTYIRQKAEVKKSKEQENQQLNSKKASKNRLLNKYHKEEKEYRKTIQKEQQRQKQLAALIRKKVEEENRRKAELARKAEEARKAKNANKKVAEKDKLTDKEYKQYKEDQLLTGNFAKNRGRLPMPVESGNISRRFGRQTNPTTKAIENNRGIYILSPKGTEARAVFDGTVFEVMYEPGAGYMVWVTHGSFTTVYAQLSLFYVKKGDKIKAKQKIGKIAQKSENTELNFYILNDKASYEDPENWLAH